MNSTTDPQTLVFHDVQNTMPRPAEIVIVEPLRHPGERRTTPRGYPLKKDVESDD
jgi:hypothetical protein